MEDSDAVLLFATVRQFRAIRDQYRLRLLAQTLGFPEPEGKDPTIQEIEKLVNQLAGKSFGSFRANQLAAQEIQALCKDLDLRIACPKPGCKKPATLTLTTARGGISGYFVFIHSAGPRKQERHGGLSKLPEKIVLTSVLSGSYRKH